MNTKHIKLLCVLLLLACFQNIFHRGDARGAEEYIIHRTTLRSPRLCGFIFKNISPQRRMRRRGIQEHTIALRSHRLCGFIFKNISPQRRMRRRGIHYSFLMQQFPSTIFFFNPNHYYFHRMHPQLQNLLRCIDLEEKEQVQRFKLDEVHSLKSLKAEGLALHPIIVTRKNFGYADYPEISFRLSFPPETHFFKDGTAIECFCNGEEPIKGVLINLDGLKGEFRLFAPDFPEWIEDNGVGIKLAPDQRTTTIMKTTLKQLETNKKLAQLFNKLHSEDQPVLNNISTKLINIDHYNHQLNESQQAAVQAIENNEEICVVHGPPGTGKTTTLVEAILQLLKKGEKILITAPSNTAVDNLAKKLLKHSLNGHPVQLLRVGNTSKADAELFAHTPEGKLAGTRMLKDIKELKKRAEEFRKMALKYKRKFGKEEREQRNLLFKEVKAIRTEIKKLQAYYEEKLFSEAKVIAGTPIGLHDAPLQKFVFNTLVMDEAGQCIEPLAWCVFPFAEKYVLAGDHLQLPPTVLSNDAAALGFNRSILEVAINKVPIVHLLDTQYRMRKTIAGFSNNWFYNGLLKTAVHLHDTGKHLIFIDTAGSGSNEKSGSNGSSLQNEAEISIAFHLIQNELPNVDRIAFISPYSGQVAAAKEIMPTEMRISTIDSFQGQEKEIVILSLVRSNDDGDIGFLKDYRRMNVAITRAIEQLIVIGDSATIGADKFYNAFLSFVEEHGTYRTIWEFDLS